MRLLYSATTTRFLSSAATVLVGLFGFGPAKALVPVTLNSLPLLAPATTSFSWDKARGQFVTCMTSDTQGNVWIATEDMGVWRYSPAAPADKQWTQFNAKNGLGDDTCYSLACDAQGRVWAGTLNHGVSVFNGQTWKTYGILEGPIGVHVVALAVSPLDGDVWGATEAGLFRYSQSAGDWTSYTREQGLPSDQANALAFNGRGDLFVGTQIDGIAIARVASGYREWQIVHGPEVMPNTPLGVGLPTNLINCLFVARNGTVYAGTTTGLAISRDDGKTWSYIRGADWEAKVKGLYHGPSPIKKPYAGSLLLEDYINCLAEDSNGNLLVGYRQTGWESLDVRTGLRVLPGQSTNTTTDYITALLPRPDGNAFLGKYGGGVVAKVISVRRRAFDDEGRANWTVAAMPSAAKPPSLARLNALLKVVSRIQVDPNELKPKVMVLDDDWLTQGDWLGRYGRYWACTCATQGSGGNYYWGAGWEEVKDLFTIGPNHNASIRIAPQITGDQLRYWVHWTYTDNPRSLELPAPYVDNRVKAHSTTWEKPRRQSEIDDHGEAYPTTMDGPHIYTTVKIPHGLFYFSLYDFNKDAHIADNSMRDYRLSIWLRDRSVSFSALDPFPLSSNNVQTRITNFYGGVYKRFIVRGPINLTIKIDKNYSKNTVLAGLTLDNVNEMPAPYFLTPEQDLAKSISQRQAIKEKIRLRLSQPIPPCASEGEAANRLFDLLEELRTVNSTWWASNRIVYYNTLYRWYTVQQTPSAKNERLNRNIGTCLYQTNQFSAWEKYQNIMGLKSARQIEQGLRWKGENTTPDEYKMITDYLDTPE
jgi:hypothetical protein